MENLKLIIMDMDGTLLNSEGIITKRTYDALMKAQEKGVKLCLASGRSWKTLKDFGLQLKIARLVFYLNVNRKDV